MDTTVRSKQNELIRARRRQAAFDTKEEAQRLNLSEEETARYMFSADSNAIWDAQQMLPYRKHPYSPKAPAYTGPIYTELGFLTSNQKSTLYDPK